MIGRIVGNFPLALRFARRELRGGIRGFGVFLICLALGVAAIAGVGSLSRAIEAGIAGDARQIAGGDVLVRTTHRDLEPEPLALLQEAGTVARHVEMRAMAVAPEGRGLTELKAVGSAYPLYGGIGLAPSLDLDLALAVRDGVPGVVVEPHLLDQLGIVLGDTIRIGAAEYQVRATIEREPDRSLGLATFGPRAMVAFDTLPDTGLVQPGSLIRYHYAVRLPEGASASAFAAELDTRFPDYGWRVRTFDDAAPGLRRTVDRLTLFLTLVGLSALLIGGVGVGNAVRAWMAGRTETIATLKCLGASSRFVFSTYLSAVFAIGLAAVGIGLVAGALVPVAATGLLQGVVPVRIVPDVYWGALVTAAAFGLLTALAFSLWPLARARAVPAASLFRDLVAPVRRLPPPRLLAVILAILGALVTLAVLTAPDPGFAIWFVVGTAGAFLLFAGCAQGVMRVARALPRPRSPALRLALANLHRPGAPTAGIVLSLGFGVAILVAVGLIEANLGNQIRERIPADAPGHFFIDIQPDQIDDFRELVRDHPAVGGLETAPMLRARIVGISGRPADPESVHPDARWALENERGLTYSADMPPGVNLVAGEWWPPDYDGPPLISVDENIARGFGIGVGDTLTFDVLGRQIEGRIASLREIDWGRIGINFSVVFSPGTLEPAPQTHIATVWSDPARDGELIREVSERMPNVSAIRVRDAIERVAGVLDQVALAVTATAGVAILSGLVVLAGAVAAEQRRRVYEAVVLKVLGATRRDVMRAMVAEFALLGVVTAIVAAAVGSVAGWAVVRHVMDLEFVFHARPVLLAGLASVAVTVAFGLTGIWRALGRKAGPELRHA